MSISGKTRWFLPCTLIDHVSFYDAFSFNVLKRIKFAAYQPASETWVEFFSHSLNNLRNFNVWSIRQGPWALLACRTLPWQQHEYTSARTQSIELCRSSTITQYIPSVRCDESHSFIVQIYRPGTDDGPRKRGSCQLLIWSSDELVPLYFQSYFPPL